MLSSRHLPIRLKKVIPLRYPANDFHDGLNMPASPPPDLVTRTLEVLDRLQPPSREGEAPSDAERLRHLVEVACTEQGWAVPPEVLDQALADHWKTWPQPPEVVESKSTVSPVPVDFGWRRPTSMEALERRRRRAWVTRARLAANRHLQWARARGCQSRAFDLAFIGGGTTLASLVAWAMGGLVAAAPAGTMAFLITIFMSGTCELRLDLGWWRLWAQPLDPWAPAYPTAGRVKRWMGVPTSQAYLEACLKGPLPLLERDAELLDWLSRHAAASIERSAQQAHLDRLMNTPATAVEAGRTTARGAASSGRVGRVWC